MIAILQDFVATPFASAIAWTLVHSIWEYALIALALWAALTVLPDSNTRYNAACGALAASVLAFAATLTAQLWGGSVAATGRSLILPPPPAPGPTGFGPHLPWFGAIPEWLVPLWLSGVALHYLFHSVSWLATLRLRVRGVCLPNPLWIERVSRLADLTGVPRPVRLLESSLARVPVVAGWLRPVILFPVGLLAAMPVGQVEAILLHELAHIRRHDYLANLVQTLAEGLLFHHPAVWWISAVIRNERENCCDDMVVAARGERLEYATALAALEQSRWALSNAPAANGGQLMQRISRLLAPGKTTRAFLSPVPTALPAAILALAAAITVVAWPTPQQPAQPAATAKDPYSLWLREDVAYIIRNDERTAFLQLQTDEERAKFIEQFWLRRDPTPGTPANEMKEDHYRRIGYANQRFGDASGLPGWKTDRGRIYITFGPPDEIDAHPAAGQSPAHQQWRYSFIQGVGTDVIVEFVDAMGNGEFRMTMDPSVKR